MRKVRAILRLRYERGYPHRTIARAVHVGAATVSEYLAKAAAKGLGWPLPEEFNDAKLEEVLFPRAPASSEREVPDFAAVHEELQRHRELTLLQLWVEYAEDNPRAYRYSRYCELYQRWKKKLNPTMRQRHRAGEKTFVDFSGKRPHIVDPKTGELQPVELFVSALGASSYTYAEATEDQSLESWAKAHESMSTYFKGSTEIWVPDNLRSGVDLSDRYEPGINRTYRELASHYGAVVIPARVAKPKDKAKVESAVQVAQRWILAVLRHHRFFSLSELNEAIREQLERLNARPDAKTRCESSRTIRAFGPACAEAVARRTLRARSVEAVHGRQRLPRRGGRLSLQRSLSADWRGRRGAYDSIDGGGGVQGKACCLASAKKSQGGTRHDP